MSNPTDTWAPPSGSPVGTSGWYLAADGVWYRSDAPPAVGYHLDESGRWTPGNGTTESWRTSRWGLGDVWWCLLAYVLAGIAGALIIVVIDLIRGGDGAFDETNPFALGAFVACNAVAIGGVMWWATSRKGLRSFAADFGLRGKWLDPLIGVGVGFSGLLLAGGLTYAIDTALGADERSSNLPVDDLTTVGQFVVFFVAVAIVTPVIEELVFRGLLYRSLLKRGRSAPAAIAITTVAFIAPHLPAAESWIELASIAGAIGALGLTFNLACHWTGNRLAAPIAAHALVNGLAAIALYAT